VSARRRLAAAALLLVVPLVACGGDDDDDDGGQALSKADFIEQADAICAAGDAELDEATEEAFAEGQPDADTLEAYIDDVVAPNLRDQFADIRALGVPDEIDGGVDSLLDAAEDRLAELEAMSGDEVLELFSAGEDPFAEVNAQADALGFTECGGGE
jgi:hypothetical protein